MPAYIYFISCFSYSEVNSQMQDPVCSVWCLLVVVITTVTRSFPSQQMASVLMICVHLTSVSVICLSVRTSRLWLVNASLVPQEMKSRTFNARKMFQYAILCVRAMVRIRRLRFTPEPLSMDVARVDPYRIKVLRKVSCLLMFYVRLMICWEFLRQN